MVVILTQQTDLRKFGKGMKSAPDLVLVHFEIPQLLKLRKFAGWEGGP
jgi:hypothetical protein